MIHKPLEELAQTEGGEAAIKIIKQNKIVKICGIIFVYMSLGVAIAILIKTGNEPLYYLCAGIGLCACILIKTYYTRIHRILNVECDPFKAEEAYTYFYLAYAKKRLERRPPYKWIYHLYISYSIMFQGDYERAFFILNQIDGRELQQSRQYLRYMFHHNMRMYYCYKNDVAVLNDMRNFFLQMSKDPHLRTRYRKLVKKEIEMLDLHFSLSRGDFSVYDYLSRRSDWRKGSPLKRTADRWVDAVVHRMQNNLEAAREDCQYIIEHGNRLYYVNMAGKMLKEIGQ